MDHFERIMATVLEAEGYWVRQSFKVNLTKDEKKAIRKESLPRPEIDLLALHVGRDEVIALEVKSYFDSQGVKLADLQAVHDVPNGRYKLFTSERYRTVVLARLKQDLIELGMAKSDTRIRLGLAVGKVYGGQSEGLRAFLSERQWLFWSPEDIRTKVTALAKRAYENDPAIITAKILLR